MNHSPRKGERLRIPDHLVDSYRSGELTSLQLARLLGAALGTVLAALHCHGIDTSRSTRNLVRSLRSKGLRPTAATVEQAARDIPALYARGETLRYIGERFGLTPEGVRHILRRQHVRLRPRGSPPRLRGPAGEEITMRQVGKVVRRRRAAAGLSVLQMARRCGVSVMTIRAVEGGRQRIQQGTLEKLAAGLGVSLGAFVAEGKVEAT